MHYLNTCTWSSICKRKQSEHLGWLGYYRRGVPIAVEKNRWYNSIFKMVRRIKDNHLTSIFYSVFNLHCNYHGGVHLVLKGVLTKRGKVHRTSAVHTRRWNKNKRDQSKRKIGNKANKRKSLVFFKALLYKSSTIQLMY